MEKIIFEKYYAALHSDWQRPKDPKAYLRLGTHEFINKVTNWGYDLLQNSLISPMWEGHTLQ